MTRNEGPNLERLQNHRRGWTGNGKMKIELALLPFPILGPVTNDMERWLHVLYRIYKVGKPV